MISKGLQVLLCGACLVSPVVLAADDTVERRTAAAQRYLKVQPVSDMVDKLLPSAALRQHVAMEKKEQFSADLRREVRMGALEKSAQQELAEKFTASELEVLAEFFGSADGVSAMKKMDRYIGTMTFEVLGEFGRIMKCFKDAAENPGVRFCVEQ